MNGNVVVGHGMLFPAARITAVDTRKITVQQPVLHRVPQNMEELRTIAVLILVPDLLPVFVSQQQVLLDVAIGQKLPHIQELFQDVVININTVLRVGQPIQVG
ncbi:MAG: hypothetical protein CO028_01625 [Candidatus Levybacteria bacterium CG_4_9_14_0_2_um_filter_35_21]|nr:MAG: hypothetical protein CO028_01625 [Candidatus Levybacteria bacterium CG_4_9_14_0_2_um_filter_35_21]